jgi:hypothetical protein
VIFFVSRADRPLHFAILLRLRSGHYCSTATSLLRSQAGQYFHVLTLATVLLAL